MNKDRNILVVGDTILDRYIFGKVDRLSPEGPFPVLDYTNEYDVLGGALNVCANISNLSPDTFINYCGFYCNNVLSLCRDYPNIGLIDSAIPVPCDQILTKIRYVARQRQLLRMDILQKYNKSNSFSLKMKLQEIIKKKYKYDLLVISDYNKGSIDECWDLIKQFDCPKLIDSKYRFLDFHDENTILKINHQEYQNLYQDLKCKEIVITMGGKGFMLKKANKTFSREAKYDEVVDVVGAGDAFLAGMCANFLETGNFDPEAMAIYGNKVAGAKVKHFGTVAVEKEEIL